jgi:hypothetical protein
MEQKSGERMWSSSWIKKSDMDMTEDIMEDMIKTGDTDMIKTDMIKTGDMDMIKIEDMDMIKDMIKIHQGNQGDNDKL